MFWEFSNIENPHTYFGINPNVDLFIASQIQMK